MLNSFAGPDAKDHESSSRFKSEFKETWDNLKSYTLAVAEAMPADHYGFKPTEEVRTFGEQFKHVSFTLYFMPRVFLQGEQLEFDANYINNAELVGESKEEVISMLSQRFDEVGEIIFSLKDKELKETVVIPFQDNKEVTKEHLIRWLKDHAVHHRGQSVVYLRMNGIEPPAYNGW